MGILLLITLCIANYALIEYFKFNGDNIIPQFDAVVLICSNDTKPIDAIYNAKSAGLHVEVIDNELIFYGIPTSNDEIYKLQKSIL